MARVLVQRGSTGSSSSSNQNRTSTAAASAPSSTSSTPAPAQPQVVSNNNNQVSLSPKDDELPEDSQEQILVDDCSVFSGAFDDQEMKNDDLSPESLNSEQNDENRKNSHTELLANNDFISSGDLVKGFSGLSAVEEEMKVWCEVLCRW